MHRLFLTVLFIIKIADAVVLDCNYSQLSKPTKRESYVCQAKVIRYDLLEKVVGVSQTHLSNKSNSDITGLWIDNQDIDFIPKDVNLFFENIKFLYIRKTKLRVITAFDLEQFPNLVELNCDGNLIETIDGDLFRNTPAIERIDFDNNKITNIGPDVFKFTPLLFTAYFKGNLCIDEKASNADEVFDLVRRFALKCPPNAEMFKNYILQGEAFRALEQRVDELGLKLEEIISDRHL